MGNPNWVKGCKGEPGRKPGKSTRATNLDQAFRAAINTFDIWLLAQVILADAFGAPQYQARIANRKFILDKCVRNAPQEFADITEEVNNETKLTPEVLQKAQELNIAIQKANETEINDNQWTEEDIEESQRL